MRGVEGVDEGVDSGAVGARGDNAGLVGAASEVATVPVEVEVPVGWVVGVDEGVGVGGGSNRPPHRLLGLGNTLDGLGGHKGLLDGSLVLLLVEPGARLRDGAVVVLVVVVNGLPGLHKLLLRLRLLGKLLTRSGSRGGNKLGGGLSVGSGGHVVALEDPEAVLAGGVPHRDRLAGLVDVAVLADPLAVGGGLLPVDGAILLGVGGSEPANMDLKSQRIQSGLTFRLQH